MDTQSKKELIKLYELAESATATTNFYPQVYKYIDFIKKSDFLSRLLADDNNAWHVYDLERSADSPKEQKGEDDLSFFLKEMKHIRSGDSYFLSNYFLTITRDIYDLLDWHYKEGFESEEATIMLNGKIRLSLVSRLKTYLEERSYGDSIYPKTDYNQLYLDWFPLWKNYLNDFHTLLLKRIEESPIESVKEVKKELVLELFSDGTVLFSDVKGFLDPTKKEYRLLQRLVIKNGGTVSHKEIARLVYKKKDSDALRLDMPDLVRKLKKKLSNLFSDVASSLVKNDYQHGYYLNLQDNQEVKFSP